MIEEAEFFLAESRALGRVIAESALPFDEPTLFKDWTPNQILRHLHMWNGAALLSLQDADGFMAMLKEAMPKMMQGGMRGYEDDRFSGLAGEDLLEAWLEGAEETADAFRVADPEARLPWAGPPMSARSSISARLMETWAHGQAIYDAAGIERQDEDRIYPIAELGVRTFGWTYTVRGERKPETKPHVVLTAPSGKVWRFNDERDDERIEGPATAFCQVVAQTRNIADVPLKVTGAVAKDWMSKAQCFAGGAETPPQPGMRRIRKNGD
ncbi:TIGR03084 family metal-binding protein [Parvularcula lutaonensis]|uniref:TIGR03084 family metal-binding protein n=1 Tax=Parvularcula lutaonensis TaxID=491923 RepID=A0ABV7MB77_9PROT|nr:TIGR03084 family metal-binding protein [Parvularcula lutaonensis]GGY38062.1 TIGR03084 family protein [Parvularcula lutaonensis]